MPAAWLKRALQTSQVLEKLSSTKDNWMAWPKDLRNPEWCSVGSRLTLWLCREWPHCARTAGAEKDEPYEVRSWVRRPQSHLGEKRRDALTFPTTTNFLQLRASA